MTEVRRRLILEWHGDYDSQPSYAQRLADGSLDVSGRQMLEEVDQTDSVNRTVVVGEGPGVAEHGLQSDAEPDGCAVEEVEGLWTDVARMDLESVLRALHCEESEAAADLQHARSCDEGESAVVHGREVGAA